MAMREDDELQLVRLLSDVMKYYRQDITKFILDVWVEACRGFEYGEVESAIKAHIAHPERGQFPPKVSDLVRSLAGTGTDRAVAAWGKVHDARRRVGGWQDVVFDDPVIHVVVTDMGGWPTVSRMDDAELSYGYNRFMTLYRSVSERGADGYPRVLAGARDPDEEYIRKGLPAPGPALVGDPVRCAQVLAQGGDPRVQLTFVAAGKDVSTLLQLPDGLSLKRLPPAPPGGA